MVEGLEFYYNHKEQDNLLLGQESETNYQIPGESKEYNINSSWIHASKVLHYINRVTFLPPGQMSKTNITMPMNLLLHLRITLNSLQKTSCI